MQRQVPQAAVWRVLQMSRRTQVAVDRELLVRKLEKAAEEAAAANEDVRAAEIRRWRAYCRWRKIAKLM